MMVMLLALYVSLANVPVITLERTHCYGPCPVYTLSIMEDGTVLYEGEDFVRVKGKAKGRITKVALEELVREFEKIDYTNLEDEYVEGKNCPQAWTDHSAATTSLNWKGKQKTIRHYQGCKGLPILGQLTALEDKIDEVVNTKQWIK
jgi:uncharacterized protein DUF6438